MNTLTYKGYLFKVQKRVDEKVVKNVSKIKKKLTSDLVLRKGNQLWFLEYIPEADVIEYIEDTDIQKYEKAEDSSN